MPEPHQSVHVTHNEQASRFEASVQGQTALTRYERRGDVLHFLHTEVPASLEGRGIGSALARTALDHARSEGLGVVPQCRFIAAFIRRHEEYEPLVRR